MFIEIIKPNVQIRLSLQKSVQIQTKKYLKNIILKHKKYKLRRSKRERQRQRKKNKTKM